MYWKTGSTSEHRREMGLGRVEKPLMETQIKRRETLKSFFHNSLRCNWLSKKLRWLWHFLSVLFSRWTIPIKISVCAAQGVEDISPHFCPDKLYSDCPGTVAKQNTRSVKPLKGNIRCLLEIQMVKNVRSCARYYEVGTQLLVKCPIIEQTIRSC